MWLQKSNIRILVGMGMHCMLTVISVSTPIINYIFFAIYYSFTRCFHQEKVGNAYTLSLYYFYNYM